jgi:hypothetical protein
MHSQVPRVDRTARGDRTRDGRRAVADYRDFDGRIRPIQASGQSVTQATQNLRSRLQNRTLAGRHGELTMMTRYVNDGRISAFAP